MGVLETVIGGAPAMSAVPAMEMPSVSGTTGWLLIVVDWPATNWGSGLAAWGAKATELDPMNRVEDLYDMGVLETVIGGAPGINVVPAIEIPWLSGRTGW